MAKLIIDNQEVEVDNGATILDAANKLGIKIPTMCFLKDYKPSTSCMVCVVKVEGMNSLMPACGTIAEDGMRIESDSDEVRQARRAALELLLSDHLGDCMGPCQVSCPANMNIPLMIRQIAAGKIRDAIVTVKKDIALPAVLGRICPAPCERACRRAEYDKAVSICLLKRYVADADLQSSEPYLPACKPLKDKRVAIVGAGPAGLAAAYYLQQQGYDCTIYDEHDKPGGMLRYAVEEEKLPREVLDKEIALIEKLGVKFQLRTRIGTELSMDDLRSDFDAVFVATGNTKPGEAEYMGLETDSDCIDINNRTYETNLQGVFAGGDAVRKRKLTVRAVADGKEAAVSIGQYLSNQIVSGAVKPFNTRIGKLMDGEIQRFMVNISKSTRVEPSHEDCGFSEDEARQEALRCLHCDCRKAESCKLRQYAQDYAARPRRYKGERSLFVQHFNHPASEGRFYPIQTFCLVFEPGKCIDCGLCVQITAQVGEELGLTFINRGFNIQVAIPFERSMAEALKHTAKQCVAACPTGALAFKDNTRMIFSDK